MSYIKNPIQYSSFSFDSIRNIIVPVFIIIIAVAGYLAFFGYWNQSLTGGEATLILSFENGEKERRFQGEVIDGMTVLSALIASSEAGQIKLQYSFSSDGRVVIRALDGYFKDSDVKINFYLNDSYINAGDINKIPIARGDVIEARLE